MNLIISAFDDTKNPDAYTYGDLAATATTSTSIRAVLRSADISAVLLRDVVSPVFFNATCFTLEPKDIDRDFMARMSDEYPVLKKLFKELVERAYIPGSPPMPKDAATEELLMSLKQTAEQLVITKKQLRFLNTVYGITRSNAVITGTGKYDSGVLVGDRTQISALDNLLSVCNALDIDIDVERCGEVYRIRSMQDIETIASTVSLNSAGLDIITGAKTLGTGYITAQSDIDRLNKTITNLHRSEFRDALHVFPTKRMAVSQMHAHTFLNYGNTTWYGARKLSCHTFSAVVLAGVPRINPNTAFLTDASQELSILAYRRYHLLNAIGCASVVNCVGIGAKYLGDVLPTVPGVIVHPHNK